MKHKFEDARMIYREEGKLLEERPHTLKLCSFVADSVVGGWRPVEGSCLSAVHHKSTMLHVKTVTRRIWSVSTFPSESE